MIRKNSSEYNNTRTLARIKNSDNASTGNGNFSSLEALKCVKHPNNALNKPLVRL